MLTNGVSIDDILKKLPEEGMNLEARAFIRRAYEVAERAHCGQLRKSGEPYILHPLHVAYLLASLNLEPAVIAAGLLHDVLEDCPSVTAGQLREQFGEEVVLLVAGVTKLKSMEDELQKDTRQRDLQELESLRKLFLVMAMDDIRVIFIKLADRLHNMRTLVHLSPARQQRMARETLEIFAPLANRLGIWVWKAELEDMCFRWLNPGMYQNLVQFISARHEERQQRLDQTIQWLRNELRANGINAEIKGRPKHIYSIYNKMHRKNIPFAKVYDTEGLRVVVDTESQCYQVLGIVHRLWTPIPGEFDDYIAHPKLNGYQSLHTAVIHADGGAFEVQIRTHQMHNVAEYGVAAHWLYKEQIAASNLLRNQVAIIRASVKELTQEDLDAQTFINTLRTDVLQEYVYVFTPQGKLIELPAGATPIDFAYHVHTEIGHSCRGARVNGKRVSLTHPLKTGDRVEIDTGRVNGPSLDWLNEELGYVKTARARQKIKQWFRRQSREANFMRGQEMVGKSLKRLGLEIPLEMVAQMFNKRYPHEEDFFVALGGGDLSLEALSSRLTAYLQGLEAAKEEADIEEMIATPPSPPPSEVSDETNILGASNLLTHVARCCSPLPGDDIIGYITRGRGVTIHRADCPNVSNMRDEDRARLIEVEWGKSKGQTFPVKAVIKAYDRAGLLRDISEVTSESEVNMASVSTGKRNRDNFLSIYITLEVTNFAVLERVLKKIEQIQNVVLARRVN